jgi:UDP-3-O-[3-hydroxymyristoyl] N-acetylglucosamine deacetylase
MNSNVDLFSREELASIKCVRESLHEEFSVLVAEAKLSPSTDFRFLNLSDVDFAGSDLRGFDFTGANLMRTNWADAVYDESTIVSNALMDGAIGFIDRDVHPKNPSVSFLAPAAVLHQTSLRGSSTVTGIGVHSGLPISLTLGPAAIDAGFVFVRTDLKESDREFHATAESVVAIEFATVLGDSNGALASSAEHLLAALRGMGIDNATIEINGPEVPIMDGSASAFVAAIDQAGIKEQDAPRRFIQVLEPVRVALGDSFGELRPHASGFRAEAEIEFAHPLIGRQNYTLDLNPESFRRDISRARTFGAMNDVARLWSAGFALGASFENSVVFDETRLLNSEGLRYADECVRHNVLDMIGDLALAGLPLLGAYRSVRGGHKLNHAVLKALMDDKSAWKIVEATKSVRSSAQTAA